MSMAAAQNAIAAWARFINSGVLFEPGPDGYSKPLGDPSDYDLEDLPFWTLVERRLRSMRASHDLRSLLIHVYWHGKPFQTFSFRPGEESQGLSFGRVLLPELKRLIRDVSAEMAPIAQEVPNA